MVKYDYGCRGWSTVVLWCLERGYWLRVDAVCEVVKIEVWSEATLLREGRFEASADLPAQVASWLKFGDRMRIASWFELYGEDLSDCPF